MNKEPYDDSKDYDVFYLECSCVCSVLRLSQYKKEKEDDGSIADRSVELALFDRHPGHMKRFFERLRWVFHMLFTGDVWGDYMILDKVEVKQLKDYIDKAVERMN